MSELQDRLEHLVNYSSQLIFVSGDTIAEQQKALTAFLSTQQDNTDISFFDGEEALDSAHYRHKISEQLLGKVDRSNASPLASLLSPLDDQGSPVLICIKQAQFLPDDFLQELWDLVLHSRHSATHQHLNVILFGDVVWAEQAKKWLPQNNSDKPILLSDESVNTSTFDAGALQRLMSEKRFFFSARNNANDDNSVSVLSQKWFIAAVLGIFFVVFVSLVAWQYPHQFAELLSSGKLPKSLANEPFLTDKNEEASVELAPYQAELEIVPSHNTEQSSSDTNEPGVDAVDAVDAVDESTISPIVEPSMTDTLLVSNWNNRASARVNKEDEDKTTNDFQVPDIVSVDQLEAQLSDETNIAAIKSELPSTANNQTDTTVDSANETAAAIFSFDEAYILTLPDNKFVVQLSGIQNKSVLNSFIKDNNLVESTWVYQTTRYGGPWYVVLYKESFESLTEAQQSIRALPTTIQQVQPFAKSVTQVKQEIARQ